VDVNFKYEMMENIMVYKNIISGIFIQRVNRFIAEVEVNGKVEIVHVKNTGRCQELFIKGARVYLEPSRNEKRKTKYSLISIYKGEKLINIDSQVPNQVVYEAIEEGIIKEIGPVDFIKREVTYNKSRFDIFFRQRGKEGFVEVKGVTLEDNNIARFPDAPTVRGRKHVLELIQAKEEGYEAYIFFLVQMAGVKEFETNVVTDQAFSEALEEARRKGVHILIYGSLVTKDSIVINGNALGWH
jgi:sugar fermentation stimulation protein A